MLDLLIVVIFIMACWKMQLYHGINENYLSRDNCTVLKGLFAVIISLHHISQNVDGGVIASNLKSVGYLSVGVFFFISGYGVMKQYKSSSDYLRGFLRKRLVAICIPYAIVVCIYWASSFSFYQRPYSLLEVIKSLVNGVPIAANSWYVIFIILFYLVFFQSATMHKKNYGRIILSCTLIFMLWVGFCLFRKFADYWFNSWLGLMGGMYWAVYEDKILAVLRKSFCRYIVTVGVLFVLGHSIYVSNDSMFRTSLQGIILALFTSLLFVSGIIGLCMKTQITNVFFAKTGKISFEYYMIHGLFIELFKSNIIPVQNSLVYGILVIICSMASAYILFHIDKRLIDYGKRLLLKEGQ